MISRYSLSWVSGFLASLKGKKSWFKKILFYDLLQGLIDEGHFINPLRKNLKKYEDLWCLLDSEHNKKELVKSN
jgi:hypothetical protein